MKFHSILPVTLAAAILATALPAKPPSEADIKKIQEALPAKAPAKPAKARKILIFSKTNGFRHGSIEPELRPSPYSEKKPVPGPQSTVKTTPCLNRTH